MGCGAGQTIACLSLSTPQLGVGVELDRTSIEMFSAIRAFAGEPSIVAVRASAEQLPFGDGSFDRVICRTVLHLVRVATVISEIARVTDSGGLLYLHILDPWFFLRSLLQLKWQQGGVPFALLNGLLLQILGVQVRIRSRTPVSYQTIGTTTRLLNKAGFEVVSEFRSRGNPLGRNHQQPKVLARRR